LLHERGLDLLIADAAIASAEGDVTTAGAIQNPNISGGLYRSFFSGHLYESHLGWFVGVGNSNGIEDVLSGKRGLRQEVAHQALSAARLSRADAQRATWTPTARTSRPTSSTFRIWPGPIRLGIPSWAATASAGLR
jgi:hypothetical protein